MQTMSQTRLVPGRECGDCKVCCVALPIDTPEIQKLSGAACRHCVAGGCAVYQTRPPVCRSYFCAWRRAAEVPQDWRPDLAGILTEIERNNPAPFAPIGYHLTLLGDPMEIIARRDLTDFLVAQVSSNVAVFMGLPGPRGHQGVRQRINTPEFVDALRTGSRAKIKIVLEDMVRRMQAHDYVPVVIKHRGNDVSS